MTVRYRAPRGPSAPLRTDTPPMRAACAQGRVCARRIRVERAHLTLSGQLLQGPAAAPAARPPRHEPAAAHRVVPRSTSAPPSPPAAATVASSGAPRTQRTTTTPCWVLSHAASVGARGCERWQPVHAVGRARGRPSERFQLALALDQGTLIVERWRRRCDCARAPLRCSLSHRRPPLSPGPDVHLSLPACASRYTGVHIRSGPVPVCLDGESDSEAAAVVARRLTAAACGYEVIAI